MVNPHKGTAQALKRGVQFKAALADVKNNVTPKPAKWKAPSIPLKTQVGVGGLTIKSLMDDEKITYEEAVQVYLAFQDSQRSPASSKKSMGTEPEDAPAPKNQVTPKARPSKAKEATETPAKSKRGRSSEARAAEAEPSPDTAQAPRKSKRGKTAEAKVAEPIPDTAEPTSKSKRGKTTEAEVAEPSPDTAEPSSSSKRGKTAGKPAPTLKRGRASSDLSKHTEAPSRRVPRKSSPAPHPSTPEPAEPAQPSSDDWDWGGDDADTVWYEYDLWRQGLPQLSEMNADLIKHRELPQDDVENGTVVLFAQATENEALSSPATNGTFALAQPTENEAPSPAMIQKQLAETLKEMLVTELRYTAMKIMWSRTLCRSLMMTLRKVSCALACNDLMLSNPSE